MCTAEFFGGYTGRLRSAGYLGLGPTRVGVLTYGRDHHVLVMGGWLGGRVIQGGAGDRRPHHVPRSLPRGRAGSIARSESRRTPPSGVISQAEGVAEEFQSRSTASPRTQASLAGGRAVG